MIMITVKANLYHARALERGFWPLERGFFFDWSVVLLALLAVVAGHLLASGALDT